MTNFNFFLTHWPYPFIRSSAFNGVLQTKPACLLGRIPANGVSSPRWLLTWPCFCSFLPVCPSGVVTVVASLVSPNSFIDR